MKIHVLVIALCAAAAVGAPALAGAPSAIPPAAIGVTHPFLVTKYGAKCDGSSDDTAAIQAAEVAASAAGGGIVVLPNSGSKRCIVSSSLLWDTNGVGLVGQGRTVSGLKWATGVQMPTATGAMIVCRSISNTQCQDTATAPTRDFVLSDVELDLSGATVASYLPQYKAVFFQHMLRPLITRTYIHDAPATNLGIDFLVAGRITDNVITGGGRLASSTGFGGSNIGIGAGNDPGEGSAISGNYAANAMRYNIFVESQLSSAQSTAQVLIANNVSYSNSTTFGEGIGDAGNTGTNIVGNRVTLPAQSSGYVFGIAMDTGTIGTVNALGGKIADNVVTGGSGCVGFYINSNSFAHYDVSNNTCTAAGTSGFNLTVAAGVTVNSLTYTDNKSYGNGTSGFIFNTSAPGAQAKNLILVGNEADGNGTTTTADYAKSGITLNGTFAGVTIQGGHLYDGAGSNGTQKYGISVNSGSTISGLRIEDVDLAGNTSSPLNLLSTPSASYISGNPGYNPLGAASVTVGASPWTYTAGASPEVLYVTGGTITGVTKGGVAVSTNGPYTLAPNSAVVVTYTSSPTAVVDRQ